MINTTHQSTPIYAEMQRRLADVRSRYYRERVVYGSILTAGTLLVLLVFLSALEAICNGSFFFRTILFIAGSAAIFILAGWLIAVPILRWKKILPGILEMEIAARVGEKFPEVKDRLWNILDIFKEYNTAGDKTHGFRPDYSPELIDASFADLQKGAAHLHFTDVVSYERVRKAGKNLAIVAVSVVLLFAVPQFDFLPAAHRIVHFRTEFRLPPAFTFLIRPGNAEIVKGESVPVSVSLIENAETVMPLHRSLPKRIAISVRQADMSSGEQVEVQADSSGQFRYMLVSIRQSAEYFATAEGIESSRYTITVVDRPVVRSLAVHLTPPSYSRLPEQSLDENIGDVLALPGTTIQWRINASKALRHASLVFKDGEELTLQSRDGDYVGRLILHHRASYHVKLEDNEGFTNVDPIEYKLDATLDEVPTVAITYPGKNIDVVDKMELPLRLKIHDDFGFTSLNLAYRLVHSRYEQARADFSSISIPITVDIKSSTDAEVSFQWDVSPMGLVPEDVVEYHAEVFDNDNVSGPKKGVSETYLLRLPSLDEVFADADKGQNDAIEKLDKSLDEEKDLKQDLNEISQEMKKNQPLDWQKQKKAEETLKRYQELTKNIDDVSKSLDTMTQAMQKNNILSSETLQKYTELQQMLQQINSPEFQEAMKRMQEAMQNVSKHAKARHLSVQLEYGPVEIALEVRDDGQGFVIDWKQETASGHYGLTGMKERAAAIGGRLEIHSEPGVGTTIRLRAAPHLGARQVVCAAHDGPDAAADGGVELHPVGGVLPLAGHAAAGGAVPAGAGVVAGPEADIGVADEHVARVEGVEVDAVAGGDVDAAGGPVAIRRGIGIGLVPRLAAIGGAQDAAGIGGVDQAGVVGRHGEADGVARPSGAETAGEPGVANVVVDRFPVTAGVGGFGHSPGGADGRAQPAVGDVSDLGMLRAGGDGGGVTLESGQGRIAPGHAAIGGHVNLAGEGEIEEWGRAGDGIGGSGKRIGTPLSSAADVKDIGRGEIDGTVRARRTRVDPDLERANVKTGGFAPGAGGYCQHNPQCLPAV